jgi:aminoglycoside phosphotransferase (APT) family kinase protein
MVDGDHHGTKLKRSARDPEQLRVDLAKWLAAHLGAAHGMVLSPLIAPGGGVANETFLFDAAWESAGRERQEGFVLRLAADEPLHLRWDLDVHARCYQAFADVADVPVPRIHAVEPDPGILGAAFFVMERIEGDIPRDFPSWTEQGFVVDCDPRRRRAMWDSAVEVLAALHRVDVDRFPFLQPRGGANGLADDIAYWRSYLDHGEDGEPLDALEHGYEWIAAHMPEPQPTEFAWGDARFCNLVFRDDRVVGVLDWDQVNLAGPETDLAWWRAVDPGALAPPDGIGSGDELVRRWEELSGRTARSLEWHDLYAQFRLGVTLLNLYRNMGTAGRLAPDAARHLARDGNAPAKAVAEHLRQLGG